MGRGVLQGTGNTRGKSDTSRVLFRNGHGDHERMRAPPQAPQTLNPNPRSYRGKARGLGA